MKCPGPSAKRQSLGSASSGAGTLAWHDIIVLDGRTAMGGVKRFMEVQEEKERQAWEAIAIGRNLRCSVCCCLLSKDEFDAFGDRCSTHQAR